MKTDTFLPKFVTAGEICQHLGISRGTIYYQMKNGTFPKQINFGRTARWERAKVIEWVEQQKAKAEHREPMPI